MSNVEDWERRNALPVGCAVLVTFGCFVAAAFFIGYPISRWLFSYHEDMSALPLILIGSFFLLGGIAFVRRLAKGQPIPHVGRGGEAPPAVELYDFIPKGVDAEKHKDSEHE